MATLPSFAILRCFEAAARHQSFTAAAEDLRISQAAVSRHVREFEALIGTELFRKQGRGVVLTRAGAALAEDLQAGLDRLRQTIRQAQAAGSGGQSLSIAALPTFGAHWLAPRLAAFRARHRDVRLILHSRSAPFDLVEQGIDLAIHYGGPEWVGGRVTPLCPEDLRAVAAPALIAQHQITTEGEALRLPLLHLISRPAQWPAYLESLGLDPKAGVAGDVFDQFAAMIAAAIQGLGAAIVPTYLIERELAQGALTAFGHPASGSDMYHVVRPRGGSRPLADAFADWITEEAARSSARRRA